MKFDIEHPLLHRRLYYQDSYLTQFESVVQQRLVYQNLPAVILQQSAFYPISGGQPHDRGLLQGVPVVEVIIDAETEAVLHLLEKEIDQDQVQGVIDWSRRFDLMQQHSGQHILSQALIRQAEAETVGFHLSQDYATIDIVGNEVTEADLEQAENLANQILYENRPITARFVSEDALATLPLRKQPAVTGPIRVVTIADFDWSACGGTHVAHTGEVGLIKIIKHQRYKKGLRLTFLCGQRALTHYQGLNAHLRDMALQLSVGVEEIPVAIQRQKTQLKQANKENDGLQRQLLEQKAQQLYQQALKLDTVSLISLVVEHEPLSAIQQLAKYSVQQEKTIVLLGVQGQKGQLIFARSNDLALDMTALLKRVGPIIGGGGGGTPDFAQGGGAQPEKVADAISAAVNLVKKQVLEMAD